MSSTVDWSVIRADWERSGDSFRALGEKYGITQQAISKRAKKEGWQQSSEVIVRKRTVNWGRLVKETKVYHYRGADNNPSFLDYPKTLVAILKNIETGSVDQYAAEAEGVAYKTWKNWLTADKRLHELVTMARSRRAVGRQEVIQKAAERGDWRASSYLLERDPHTRDNFKKPEESGGTIQIVLNMPRGSFSDTRVIEGETDEDHPRLPSEREAEAST